MQIQGLTAVVTGGGSGLGEATTRALADRGARVTILDLPSSKGAEVADSLGDSVVLRRCKLTPMGGRDGAGEVIKLEVGGPAQSQQAVAQVILRLEQTPLFRSVKLIDTRREPFRDTHAVAFRAECILDSEQEAGL